MAEHRVPMLGAALRRRADPTKSSDPRVRELVAALATLDVAPAPRAAFRAELRAQLVAVTPRLVEEGNAEARVEAKPSGKPATERQPLRFKKPLIALVGALAAIIVLLGGAVLLSRNALPGDALYGVKRASENTEYSLTGGAVDKGNLKLEFAARRIGEVADLLNTPIAMAAGTGAMAGSGAINAETSKLVRDTLSSANDDVTTAGRLLGNAARQKHSAAPLNDLTSWAKPQITRMTGIIKGIPPGNDGVKARAVHTRSLIRAALTGANAFKTEVGGSTGRPGTSNPTNATQPGRTTTNPASTNPGRASTTTPGTTPGRASATKTGSPARQGTGQGSTTAKPGAPAKTTPGVPGLPSVPTISVPNGQPSTSIAPVIGVDSCGVHATVAGVGITIGGC
jgi:hypothetical protein